MLGILEIVFWPVAVLAVAVYVENDTFHILLAAVAFAAMTLRDPGTHL